ncbi:ABC transporter substrate-binding protein [Enterococcus sp. DIV0876]|uniref:ABC transporter substrate-binding protein n=1 Tax=Enterococcus sp. DIV0876 TaxID=2774633 RepID=UPI003D2FAABE
MNKWCKIIGLGLVLVTLSACGSENSSTQASSSAAESTYPLTISNYTKAEGGSEWTAKDQTFAAAPKKVLANTQPAAELLLHLGLKDRIAGVGATFGAADESVAAEYAELNDLGSDYISKETALSVDPDMIFGRGGLFDNQDWGVGTVDSLNEMGIPTYVQETSVTGATFDSVYKDIENLGKIFDVPDAAAAFEQELKERQAALEEKVADKEVQTFAHLFMSDPSEVSVYAAQDESFFNSNFEMIKLDNVFKDYSGEVSVETLIETDPDVLIVGDWSTIEGSVSGEEIIKGLYDNEKLSSMKAIKNKQVYALDYNYLFGYGYQALTGLEQLVDEMAQE